MLLRTVFVAAVLAALPHAQSEAPRNTRDERAARRLLTLQSGSVLRARARRVDAGWEAERNGEWVLLAPGSVLEAQLEKEALGDWRDRERSARRADDEAAARFANVRWAAERGLYSEAMEELDRLLEIEPWSAAFLEWLRTDPIPVRTPERSPKLVEEAARLTPAARELLWTRLEPDETLRTQLVEALASGASPRRRAAAAHGLRRLFPGEALRELAARSLLDASADVRRESALALGAADSDSVNAPLAGALASDHPALRRHAAEALALTRRVTAVQPLVARLAALQGSDWSPPASHVFVGRRIDYIQDFDVEVAQNASIARPRISSALEGAVLDVRVLGTETVSANRERGTIRRSLESLTGLRPGTTGRAWLDWWKRSGEDWLSQAARERPASPVTGSADG